MMRKMKALSIVCIFIIMFVAHTACAIQPAPGQAPGIPCSGDSTDNSPSTTPPIRIAIDGPSVLATGTSGGEQVEYKIAITGGPASVAENGTNVNWSYKAYLTGSYANADNKSAPLLESAASGFSNKTGNFTFNVTAPINECTITLVVNGTSAIIGNASLTVERTMNIKVVKPVILTASVHNWGKIGVKNIKVSFYVDSKYIGERKIASLAGNSSTNTTLNWTVADYPIGYHMAKIIISGGGPMVQFANKQTTIEYEFYVGSLSPDPWGKAWLAIGVLLLVLVITMLVLAYMSTGRPPVQPVKKL